MKDSHAVNSKMAHDLISNAPSKVGGGEIADHRDFEGKKLSNLPKDPNAKPDDLRSLRSEHDYSTKKNFTEML